MKPRDPRQAHDQRLQLRVDLRDHVFRRGRGKARKNDVADHQARRTSKLATPIAFSAVAAMSSAVRPASAYMPAGLS